MTKRYNKSRNAYFIRLLAGEPWVYERDEPTVAERVEIAALLRVLAMGGMNRRRPGIGII